MVLFVFCSLTKTITIILYMYNMYQAVPGSQSSIPVNWFHSVRQSLTHPGLNRKMAGEEWQRFFNSTTVRKDQVDARSEEGVPLGKALVSSTD